MGPTLGIEISQRGLHRLAVMLTGKTGDLPYAKSIDGRLRKLLQLPAADENGPMHNIEEIDLLDDKSVIRPLSWIGDFFFSTGFCVCNADFCRNFALEGA